jgi:outer membrane protein assembly factor BamA
VFARLALAPVTLGAQGRSPVEQEHPEVKKLVLAGVKSVDRQELGRNIATDQSECKTLLLKVLLFCAISHSPAFYDRYYLDRDEMKRDVLRIRVFYWKRGYRNAEVDTLVTPYRGGVAVTFTIRENEPTRVARLAVLYDSTTIRRRRLRGLVRLRAGDPLNMLALDSSRVRLMNEMWEKAYPDATVDTAVVVDTARKRANVRIAVAPGKRATVGAITIRGAEEIAPRTIANTLTFQTGQLFKRSDMLQSQRNLYESNLFRQALVEVPPQTDSVKDIVITVREAPLHEARAGGGFNTIEYFQLDGRFTHYNVLGGARRLDLTGAVGNLGARSLAGRGIFRQLGEPAPGETVDDAFFRPTWNASIDFKQPAFLQRPENSLGVGAFVHRRAAPQVFIDRGYGGNATYTRNLAQRTQASATYRFEITRVEANDVYFCVNFGVCDESTVSLLRRNQRLSPVIASYNRDRTDEPFSPTSGYLVRADLEHASTYTASQYRYNRAFADASGYWPVRRQRLKGWASQSVSPSVSTTVLAGHLRLGVVRPLASGSHGSDVIHPRKRFYAGGSQSVRGFGENMLGPRVLTVDPAKLERLGCSLELGRIEFCDPNASDTTAKATALSDGDFFPRPLGGTSVAEASVELRFPVWRKITGAVFVDGAVVGSAALNSLGDIVNIASLTRGTAALTPGFGARYFTRVGPIRVDLGYNPTRGQQYSVLTEVCNVQLENGQCPAGHNQLVALNTPRRMTGGRNLFERLTLHLSIGQAY